MLTLDVEIHDGKTLLSSIWTIGIDWNQLFDRNTMPRPENPKSTSANVD